jgi:hypothetical protein
MDLTVGGVHTGVMFFSAVCSETGREVLLGPANFVDLRDGPLGFELEYSCYCGRRGITYPRTGTLGRCGA